MTRPDYTAYPALALLPALVRQQRRLEAELVPLDAVATDEKSIRTQIDQLLLKAGIASGEGVVCLGYDVLHHERAGQTRLNQDTLMAEFVAAGVDHALVESIVAVATERGDPSSYATVKPAKGAQVRDARPKLTMAKARLAPARRRG